MKTVRFQGTDYEVPDWARWIAQDYFGMVRAYDLKPKNTGYIWREQERSQVTILSHAAAPMVLLEIE